MKENTNFFERLLQLIENKDFKTINNFAKKGLNYKSSQKLNRLRIKGTHPSYQIITDISNLFADLNTEWLISGEGEMLKKEEKLDYNNVNFSKNIVEEAEVEYKTAKDELIESLRQTIASQKEIIAMQKEKIKALETTVNATLHRKSA